MASRSIDEKRLLDIEKKLKDQLEQIEKLERKPEPGEDSTLALSRDVVDLGNVPACGVHKTGEQVIGNGSWTEVSFGTVTWDTDGMADLSNNGVTIRRAGLYFVAGGARFATDAGAGGWRGVKVRVNDTIYFMGETMAAHADSNHRLSCGVDRYFNLGDTITVMVYQKSGGNLNLNGSSATEPGPQLTARLVADVGDIRTEMA